MFVVVEEPGGGRDIAVGEQDQGFEEYPLGRGQQRLHELGGVGTAGVDGDVGHQPVNVVGYHRRGRGHDPTSTVEFGHRIVGPAQRPRHPGPLQGASQQ
jgi:hypothetical protein